MKERLKKVGKCLAVLLAVGIAYFLICYRLGFGLPCMFNKITGLKCPGCGITRMCISLLKGDIYSAWVYNRGVLIILPLIAYFLAREIYLYVRYNNMTLQKWERVVAVIAIIYLLTFALLRNFLGW